MDAPCDDESVDYALAKSPTGLKRGTEGVSYASMESKPTTPLIRAVDFVDGNLIIVELTDGSTVQVTLAQIMRLKPKVQAVGEPDLK